MKRTLGLLILSMLLLSSCQTRLKTARTAATEASLQSVAVADLKVADERITYTLVPDKSIQRGGFENVKQAVLNEALEKNGNADVLLDSRYVVTKKRSLFGSKITSITVSGRPAFYSNFRALNDSVWSNPAFRGVASQRPYIKGDVLGGYLSKSEKYRTRGYEWSVSASALYTYFDADDTDCYVCDDADGDNDYSLGVLTSFGYRFNSRFYLGAGIGFVYCNLNEDGFIPLYANARLDFSKKEKTFFLDYKLGYGVAGVDGDGTYGVFGAISVGYSFGKFEIALQSMFQGYEFEDSHNRWDSSCDGVFGSFGLTFSRRF